MARKPRLYFPGAFYHLLNRGNQRQPIFHDESDYQTLMAALAAASVRYQLRIHAFCLMPNHFHLLAEVDLFAPALAMRSLQTCYALLQPSISESGACFSGTVSSHLV